MRNHYIFSEEYYCSKCKHPHHFRSGKGANHIGFASKEMQRFALLNYSTYPKTLVK